MVRTTRCWRDDEQSADWLGAVHPRDTEVRLTRCWREVVWTPSAGKGGFWLGTVMPVAGLCPACSRGNAAGLDGLSASRSSHFGFALDAHPLAAGLPR